jgi:hypothetical protein
MIELQQRIDCMPLTNPDDGGSTLDMVSTISTEEDNANNKDNTSQKSEKSDGEKSDKSQDSRLSAGSLGRSMSDSGISQGSLKQLRNLSRREAIQRAVSVKDGPGESDGLPGHSMSRTTSGPGGTLGRTMSKTRTFSKRAVSQKPEAVEEGGARPTFTNWYNKKKDRQELAETLRKLVEDGPAGPLAQLGRTASAPGATSSATSNSMGSCRLGTTGTSFSSWTGGESHQ